jgi:hypothetical protein
VENFVAHQREDKLLEDIKEKEEKVEDKDPLE